jgi:hypothetical protein
MLASNPGTFTGQIVEVYVMATTWPWSPKPLRGRYGRVTKYGSLFQTLILGRSAWNTLIDRFRLDRNNSVWGIALKASTEESFSRHQSGAFATPSLHVELWRV